MSEFSQPSQLVINLPEWLTSYARTYVPTLDVHQRMQFVIGAARCNVERGSGGPFAAAVFEGATGELLSLGVNVVVSEGLSILHAEMVALSLAQRKCGTYDLSDKGDCELFSSAEPCAMCLGAIPWSGVKRVVTGATGSDVEAVGFDEGDKPSQWPVRMVSRGIDTICNIERKAAMDVLQQYRRKDGRIY